MMARRTLIEAALGLTTAAVVSGTAVAETKPATKTGQPEATGSCGCGRVDVHAHFLPDPYVKALTAAGIRQADGGVPIPSWSAEAHLAMMAQHNIATSILSISSPGLKFVAPDRRAALARAVNEEGAALCKNHPDKFGFFASLPITEMPASLVELDHAFDVLGADGIVLETNSAGRYLGEADFSPLFERLQARQAVLYLHPTSPACFEQIGMGFPAPMIEFPFETVRTVTSLIFNGVLRRFPDVKVILSHGGGALPSLVSRLSLIAAAPFVHPRPEGGGAEVVEDVRRLYFDLALSATPLTFDALLKITSVSHILFGTDFPFATPPAVAANIKGFDAIMAGLPDQERRLVAYDNAATLFPRLREFLRPRG
jgi:predicted TIM-barrel fold metal-dependent hydrolase